MAIFLFSPRKVLAKIEITDSPHEIGINEEFTVRVRLTKISGSHYLGIGVHKEAGQEYFGLTKNNDNWVEMEDNNCADFPLVVVNGEIWENNLTGKIIYGEKGFDGSLGEYILKIIKYTEASCLNGKSKSYSEGETIFSLTDTTSPPLSPVLPTPSPSPEAINSPSPILVTATFQINEVKNDEGDLLSSVKVYLDDVYLHHYAPETLTFCDGCQCDTSVSCGFGEHTIRLEKTNYKDWTETKIIKTGDFYEVNPIMSLAESDSDTISSPSPSSSLTSSAKPVKVIGSTLLGKVLGEEESSPAGLFPWEATEEAKEEGSSLSARGKLLPKLFLILGFGFLVVSGIWVCYTHRKELKHGES
ncbi:MAG TPA: hypothetical protein VMY36_01635 [Patescibacteria group bacterium]|nr:hypothetical protein [Patescibacteria group bacterium]